MSTADEGTGDRRCGQITSRTAAKWQATGCRDVPVLEGRDDLGAGRGVLPGRLELLACASTAWWNRQPEGRVGRAGDVALQDDPLLLAPGPDRAAGPAESSAWVYG